MIDSFASHIETLINSQTFAITVSALILAKPANIIIKKVLGNHQPESAESDANGAGALIGILERYIIFILLIVNQYVGIGLILTAKSITRYDMIVKDKKFGEYYLLY